MSGEAGGDDDVVFFSGGEVFDFEAEARGEIGELFVECGRDAGDGDVECAGALVGGRFGDPDFFGLRGERVQRRGELEAVEAFFGEGWGLEGLFDEVAELIGDVFGCGEFCEFEEFSGWGDGGEGEGAGGGLRGVVEEVEVEGGGFAACGAGAALFALRGGWV